MSMHLVTVAVVVDPRLLFGAELYGMNRKLTDKMQVLMNRALCACIGARRVGNVPSVGLWKEVRTLPICALAGACRARAYAKAMGLKTWIRNTVLQPFRSRNWTWCSGVPRWIKRFALPNASTFIQTAYLGAGWQALDPAVLVEVVKACIMARECKLHQKVTRLMVAQTVWYEAANFGKTPLTRVYGGQTPDKGCLKNPAMILYSRMPTLWLKLSQWTHQWKVPHLATVALWNRIRRRQLPSHNS